MAGCEDINTVCKENAKFTIHHELGSPNATPETKSSGVSLMQQVSPTRGEHAVALMTSKLSNLAVQRPSALVSSDIKPEPKHSFIAGSAFESRGLFDNPSRNTPASIALPRPIGTKALVMPKLDTSDGPENTKPRTPLHADRSLLLTNDIGPTGVTTPPSARPAEKELFRNDEMERLKKQLEAANGKIAAMDQELNQQRITSHNLDSLLRSPEPSEVGSELCGPPKLANRFPSFLSTGSLSDPNSVVSPSEASQGWDDGRMTDSSLLNNNKSWNRTVSGSSWNAPDAHTHFGGAQHSAGPSQQSARSNIYQPFAMTYGLSGHASGFRPEESRNASSMSAYNGYNSYPCSGIGSSLQGSPSMASKHPSLALASMPFQQHHLPEGPFGTTTGDFARQESSMANYPTFSGFAGLSSINDAGSTFVPPMEPMNYRRLLDRNSSCDWKYIVDKIVCSNDQQASIFLQQKLKIAPAEQKFDLIESIIGHSYPLMINRFGNFLIQRCLEQGTNEQVVAIAGAIHGNVLNLSMDAFGCHVVQKALDIVPEDIKASMVRELLHRIPETVVHRYACHVWQKLFELRWTGTPPQIMKHVNEALRGMWHEVALGETGSLVVQNIFENCLEEDKRPCINEILASIDLIAHGQFGNWCIQHVCEHGLPADRSRAIEHVLRFASDYSTDQFASKVAEKCLKVAGSEFTERYLERVCEGRPDRPRMPLIDIAGDQYGNYLIQFILGNASAHHRDIVSTHIRKHMVSLRGSKFGSRVAMLCTNPSFATRPQMQGPFSNRFGHAGYNMGLRPPMNMPYR